MDSATTDLGPSAGVYHGLDETIRVEAKFKNARLYDAIARDSVPLNDSNRSVGLHRFGPIKAFCELHHLNWSAVYELLNLQKPPFKKNGDIRLICEQLASLLGHDIAYLFPSEIYAKKWPRLLVTYADTARFVSLELATRDALALPPAQEDALVRVDIQDAVASVLQTITPREERVIKMRFGLDGEDEHTLDEIGEQLQVSQERVRQIESKALRKLRHPTRSGPLRAAVSGRVNKHKSIVSAPLLSPPSSATKSHVEPMRMRHRFVVTMSVHPLEIRSATWSPNDPLWSLQITLTDQEVGRVLISSSVMDSHPSRVRVVVEVFGSVSAKDEKILRDAKAIRSWSFNSGHPPA